METGRSRLYNYCELHWNYDSFIRRLLNKLKLRQDIVRLPVTEMGCAAGISGIIYAKNFLSNPGKRAAVIAVESPTATFQLNDFSMSNIVSAAIFGDGAACVLLFSRRR
jgi:predicted naringenin-chalcone synthase